MKKGLVVWFTGLPSAGKTTLSKEVFRRLRGEVKKMALLDGDVMRRRICSDLGFSAADRQENVRRIGDLARRMAESGRVVLAPVIAPYRDSREAVRRRVSNFVEVYVNAPLAVCERRDVKGLYKKARRGEIEHMTGVDDPYEPPLNPEVEVRTDLLGVEECAEQVTAFLRRRLTK